MAFPQHHHQLEQQQQQQQQSIPFRNFVPIANGQVSAAQIALLNTAGFTDQSHPQQYPPSFVHVMGLAPAADGGGGSNGWGCAEAPPAAKRRLKEQEFLENSPQISSVDFLQTRSVSTGLGLSLEDRRAAVASSSSGDSPLLPMIDDEIDRELQRQDAEMDRFVRVQGEQLRRVILEKVQAKQLQTLASVEDKILGKLREKDTEVEDINKKNRELEEQMEQLTVEAGTWQNRANYNENMITALNYHLQQVLAQGRDSKEGCGDSEVDDTASCCNVGTVDFNLVYKENKDLKELMFCKVCQVNEACMLLLPCRHLCLCKDCESKYSFCPLCRSSKFIGMEIYM